MDFTRREKTREILIVELVSLKNALNNFHFHNQVSVDARSVFVPCHTPFFNQIEELSFNEKRLFFLKSRITRSLV